MHSTGRPTLAGSRKAGCSVVIDRRSWRVPAVFEFVGASAKVDRDEMYRVFNMGIGFVLMVRSRDAEETLAILKKRRAKPSMIGFVETGGSGVRFVN